MWPFVRALRPMPRPMPTIRKSGNPGAILLIRREIAFHSPPSFKGDPTAFPGGRGLPAARGEPPGNTSASVVKRRHRPGAAPRAGPEPGRLAKRREGKMRLLARASWHFCDKERNYLPKQKYTRTQCRNSAILRAGPVWPVLGRLFPRFAVAVRPPARPSCASGPRALREWAYGEGRAVGADGEVPSLHRAEDALREPSASAGDH